MKKISKLVHKGEGDSSIHKTPLYQNIQSLDPQQKRAIAAVYIIASRSWIKSNAKKFKMIDFMDKDQQKDLMSLLEFQDVPVEGFLVKIPDKDLRWMVLWHYLNFTILEEKKYDSRMRTSLMQLAHDMDIDEKEVAKGEYKIGYHLQHAMKEMKNLQKHKDSSATSGRWWKLGGAALLGGGLIALTGGLAAPVILPALVGVVGLVAAGGAALGIGSSVIVLTGAATGIITIGGLPLVVGVFGVAGGGLTAYKLNKRLAGITHFKFTKVVSDEQAMILKRLNDEIDKEQKKLKKELEKIEEKKSGKTRHRSSSKKKDSPKEEEKKKQTTTTTTTTTSTTSSTEKSPRRHRSSSTSSNKSPKKVSESTEKSPRRHRSSSTSSNKSPKKVSESTEKSPRRSRSSSTNKSPRKSPKGSPSNSATKKSPRRNRSSSRASAERARLEEIKEDHKGMQVFIGVWGCLNYHMLHEKVGAREFAVKWQDMCECAPYADHHVLEWEPEVLSRLGHSIRDFVLSELGGEIFKIWLAAVSMTAAVALSAVMGPLAILKAFTVINNPWTIASNRAFKTGKVLAAVLRERVQGNRPVSLIGVGLGAKVIFTALQHLAEDEDGGQGIVENVYLIGAAVESHYVGKWEKARKVVSGRLVNAYCRKDWILAYLFRSLQLSSSVAGLAPIPHNNVENICLDDICNGYSSYEDPIIFKKVLKRLKLSRGLQLEETVEEIEEESTPATIEVERVNKQLEKMKEENKNKTHEELKEDMEQAAHNLAREVKNKGEDFIERTEPDLAKEEEVASDQEMESLDKSDEED